MHEIFSWVVTHLMLQLLFEQILIAANYVVVTGTWRFVPNLCLACLIIQNFVEEIVRDTLHPKKTPTHQPKKNRYKIRIFGVKMFISMYSWSYFQAQSSTAILCG